MGTPHCQTIRLPLPWNPPQRISVGCNFIRCRIIEPSKVPAPMGHKTRYKDGIFEKAFISFLTGKMDKFASYDSASTGEKCDDVLYDSQYETFVHVSKRVAMSRTRKQQQEVVREVLLSVLPSDQLDLFRKLFPPKKWAFELYALFTGFLFYWLIGPSEVVDVEVNGGKQRSGVHIKKCRYLENVGCVGMCVNMCKFPTQDFFTNEIGIPLTMTPSE